MKAAELRNMSLEDLRGELVEQRRVYFNLRFRNAAGEDIGTAEMKKARREIARMKTVLTEKLCEEREPGQPKPQENT